jgi:hypothetical protein
VWGRDKQRFIALAFKIETALGDLMKNRYYVH